MKNSLNASVVTVTPAWREWTWYIGAAIVALCAAAFFLIGVTGLVVKALLTGIGGVVAVATWRATNFRTPDDRFTYWYRVHRSGEFEELLNGRWYEHIGGGTIIKLTSKQTIYFSLPDELQEHFPAPHFQIKVEFTPHRIGALGINRFADWLELLEYEIRIRTRYRESSPKHTMDEWQKELDFLSASRWAIFLAHEAEPLQTRPD